MALSIDRWTIAIFVLLAAGSAAGAEPKIPPAEACPEISRAVARLSAAEHEQAFALDLYSKGDAAGLGPHRGALPAVEVRLAGMLDRISELSAMLERVRAEPGSLDDATVQECLQVGERALRRGEQVSSEVERVVVRARGYAPDQSISGRIKSSRSSPGVISELTQPGDAEP